MQTDHAVLVMEAEVVVKGLFFTEAEVVAVAVVVEEELVQQPVVALLHAGSCRCIHWKRLTVEPFPAQQLV